MTRGPRVKSRSSIYHIMLRGANKQEIFHDEEDCFKFLDTLEKYKAQSELKIYAWCLMNNHVHLLLKEGNEPLATTMKRIGVSFVSYYNRKYLTTGHLFQDRFKSENVESARYLLTVIRYIHQNPVKAGMVNRAQEWRWSSCLGYYGHSNYSKKLLESQPVLGMFSDDPSVALTRFIEFNEKNTDEECMDEQENVKRRLSDDEARIVIKSRLGAIEIAQIKSLPREQRNDVIREVKNIHGLSYRQTARILGVSPNLVFRA